MIKEFVQKWEERKREIREKFTVSHPESYEDIVRAVIEILYDEDAYDGTPNPECIHEIDDGDYQGTLVYVVAESGYQPRTYWYVRVDYGSCSGCDTLEAIRQYDGEPPTEEQTIQYMRLALHILQGLKQMDGEVA
jgi:hypothetical protein